MAEIIAVSCGIGKSFEEAVNAVKTAKKNKGKVLYNIEVYQGRKLRSKIPESIKQRVSNYIELSKVLNEDQRKMLEAISLHDPVTGLLNKIGFALKLQRLKDIQIIEGYYLLFDLDDLHEWNNKIGYSKVDKKLEAIGRGILNSIRSNRERAADILGHRLNESAGDEFLIFAPSKQSKENLEAIKGMARRIIKRVYSAQKICSK